VIEQWRYIPGWPGYKVSSLGRIRRLERVDILGRVWTEKFLRLHGRCVSVMRNGEYYDVQLAKLVLFAFVGPPPQGKELACHKDDDVTNNAVENLKWGSKKDNWEDAVANGKWKITEERNQKISETLLGHDVTISTRLKIKKTLQDKSSSPRYLYDGRSQTAAQWSEELGISKHLIGWRVRKGWSVEQALFTPARKYTRPGECQ